MQLKLVKDFRDFRLVYYWINPLKKKIISPLMPTLLHAAEWRAEYITSAYTGAERRQNKTDRRYADSNDTVGESRNNRGGRRITDNPVSIDYDISVKKIAELSTVEA